MVFRVQRVFQMIFSIGVLFALAQPASANRLADDGKHGTHCSPLPGDKCEPMLRKWFERGCITKAEMEHGLTIRPMRVPQCADPDGAWLFNSWCYCSCFAKGTRILVEDQNLFIEAWVAVEDVVKNTKRYKLLVPMVGSDSGYMKYEKLEIADWTEGPEANPLVVLKSKSGRNLVVTQR